MLALTKRRSGASRGRRPEFECARTASSRRPEAAAVRTAPSRADTREVPTADGPTTGSHVVIGPAKCWRRKKRAIRREIASVWCAKEQEDDVVVAAAATSSGGPGARVTVRPVTPGPGGLERRRCDLPPVGYPDDRQHGRGAGQGPAGLRQGARRLPAGPPAVPRVQRVSTVPLHFIPIHSLQQLCLWLLHATTPLCTKQKRIAATNTQATDDIIIIENQ